MKMKGIVAVGIFALLSMATAVFALEMTGKVTTLDRTKNTITVKGEKLDAGFDCETGTLIKDIKLGDQVVVQYDEAAGKKKATKITPVKANTK